MLKNTLIDKFLKIIKKKDLKKNIFTKLIQEIEKMSISIPNKELQITIKTLYTKTMPRPEMLHL